MLEAGIDGIQNKIDPGEPTEINIYSLTEEEREAMGIQVLPSSLWEAYHALEEDPLILSTLGAHPSEKFLELKYKEWDEYRAVKSMIYDLSMIRLISFIQNLKI